MQDSRSNNDQEILILSMAGADALITALDSTLGVNVKLAQAAKHYRESVHRVDNVGTSTSDTQ